MAPKVHQLTKTVRVTVGKNRIEIEADGRSLLMTEIENMSSGGRVVLQLDEPRPLDEAELDDNPIGPTPLS